ncbi:dihydroorotase [Oscillospiraceae bacterium OttesenSCG-928-F05]|nr:dihydroorotase [Oscillospiraceae bacterium OttesenSCG-928-F05]
MILISGCRRICPKTGEDIGCDMIIDKGKVADIGRFERSDRFEKIIDGAGLIAAPGLVDVHVHFRDSGQTHKEDLFTGARAAAAGGYTTVVCMANVSPALDTPEAVRDVLERGGRAPVHVHTVGAVTEGLRGEKLTDFQALKAAGACGVSDDGVPLRDPAVALEAMARAAACGLPISLHEEEPGLIGTAGVNAGRAAEALGLAGAPGISECVMVARDLLLAAETGATVNIQHVSTAGAVALIRRAAADGVRVWAEATPQHFSLTEAAVLEKGTLAKVNPPLRTEADRLAVIEGLRDGTLNLIATDHAPHTKDEKAKSFTDAPSGMIGLETALGLAVRELVRPGLLSYIELFRLMALNPAALYGFDAGYLAKGGPADIVLFDENAAWTVESFRSKSSNSPFVGETLPVKVKYTLCGGEVVYEG